MNTKDIRIQLALAVNGPYASLEDNNMDLEDLLWKAGEHRRQIELAHSWLDNQGVERGGLTVRGRLEKL